MKRTAWTIALVALTVLSLGAQAVYPPAPAFKGQDVTGRAIDSAALKGKVIVVNFWATWCPPCVTELPHFEKLSREYQGKGVKFILVSLDFPSQIDSKLIPFLKKNKVTADVRLMTDLDYNSWIDKVDKNWQGNIPVTLFFNNARKSRYLHPSEVTEKELRELIIKYKQ